MGSSPGKNWKAHQCGENANRGICTVSEKGDKKSVGYKNS